MRMKSMKAKIILTILAILCLFGMNGLAQNNVKGDNVKMVVYESGGKIAGVFAETGSGQWVEFQPGKRNNFSETGRDE